MFPRWIHTKWTKLWSLEIIAPLGPMSYQWLLQRAAIELSNECSECDDSHSVSQKFLALHKLLNWSERMINGKSFISLLCLLSKTYANRANFVFHEKRWYFRFQYLLDIFKIKWEARENKQNFFSLCSKCAIDSWLTPI